MTSDDQGSNRWDIRDTQNPSNVSRSCLQIYRTVHLSHCSECWMPLPALWLVLRHVPMSAALWSRYTGYRSPSDTIQTMSSRTAWATEPVRHACHTPLHGPSQCTANVGSALRRTTNSTSHARRQHLKTECSVAEPCDRNNLPADIRNTTDLSTFKRTIKIHFYRLAYDN